MPQLSYKKPSETINSNVTDIQQPKNSFLSLLFGYLRYAAAGVKRFCFVFSLTQPSWNLCLVCPRTKNLGIQVCHPLSATSYC